MNSNFHYKIHLLGFSHQILDGWRNIFYIIVTIVVIAIGLLLDRRIGGAFIGGGVVGLLCHWSSTYKCFMDLPESYRISELRHVVAHYKYMPSKRNIMVFILDTPRWMRFDHQNLSIKKVNCSNVLIGPLYMLKIIRKELNRT